MKRKDKNTQPLKLPTPEEINPYPGDMDRETAKRNFSGKSLEEAELMFRRKPHFYFEDLTYMGPVAFRFYVKAAIAYIKSEHSHGDQYAIDSFSSILKFRLKWDLKKDKSALKPIAENLIDVCEHIILHYSNYDLNPDIYRDLRSRYKLLVESFRKMG